MSNNLENFEGFPKDGSLWMVKYIDQFHQAHERSRSAAVQVLLQKLPEMSEDTFGQLGVDECKRLLGRRYGASMPEFTFGRILVGTLPVVSIGDVFRDGMKVGELPKQRRKIYLLPGDSDAERFTAGQDLPRPPGWTVPAAPKILNPSEYAGMFDHTGHGVFLSNSRLLKFGRREQYLPVTYLIPCTTVFKAFYAVHTELAKAFSAGPWQSSLQEVISMKRTGGGLITESIDDGKQWNIVLQTAVPNDYAPLLALYLFDSYGQACAQAIHTMALQDRQGHARRPWYASASIPIRAVREPVELLCKCLELKSSKSFDELGEPVELRKYLVTEICASTWPTHYPPIGLSRTNAGDSSAHPEKLERSAPYATRPKTKESDASTSVAQDCDADKYSTNITLRGSEWGWLGTGPITFKLQKASSKKYEGGLALSGKDSDVVSTGAATSEYHTLAKGQAKTLVRVPNSRFEHIVEALEALKRERFIDSIDIVRAHRPGQGTDRNGRQCWKFIDEDSRLKGRGPCAGWRSVYQGAKGHRTAYYRTALVMRLGIQKEQHYWIEIECRETETYWSVLLSNLGMAAHDFIAATLDAIAERRAVKLKIGLSEDFTGADVTIATYKHRYDKSRKKIVPESLKDFFAKSIRS